MIKTSIRFFDNIPVRAVWDDETSKWWFCAVDIAEALTGSKSPRKYWNTIKTRNPQLSSICRQLKLMAKLSATLLRKSSHRGERKQVVEI